jgi:RNA polymerase sigma-70 factor (ECF subfamily)
MLARATLRRGRCPWVVTTMRSLPNMSNSAAFPSSQFLAEHRDFVRRLAFGLARDEAGADDLEQETWLAVFGSGGQALAHPRAWLATAMRRRAANVARAESHRREHEAAAAKSDVHDEFELRERVAFQHSVVAAVLELEEPYRSVVMLRYFENLSPAAIAQRRKVPAATVRSQISRAHTQLRTRLEQREGGREAWCAALAVFLDHSKTVGLSAQAIALATGAVVLAGGLTAAFVLSKPSNSRPPAAVVAAMNPNRETPSREPESDSARVAVMAPDVQLPAAANREGPSGDELATKSLDDLADMAIRVEDELRKRLLTPDEQLTKQWQSEHPGTPMEFARLLNRQKFNLQFESGPVGVRGGGFFYSFATRSYDFDDEPTIGLDGELGTNDWSKGATIIDLGSVDPTGVPSNLDASARETFDAFSRGPALTQAGVDPVLRAFIAEHKLRPGAAPALQHCYLLRSVKPNLHDVLAVFSLIQQDELGVTLAWRVLQTWPVPDRRIGPVEKTPRKELASEAWAAPMSTQGLLLLLGRIRERTTSILMAIPDSLRAKWQGRPLARLLHDWSGERLVNLRGGGCFFSFATNSNSYDEQPDIGLSREFLSAQMYGRSAGLVLDVGDTTLDAINERFTPSNDNDAPRAWELAWNYERTTAATNGTKSLVVSDEDDQRFRALKGWPRALAITGHSYIARTVLPGEHDHLVAFQVVDQDEHGIFITWRILKTWPK